MTIVPLPPEQHATIMAAINASEGLSASEWDAMFDDNEEN
jgi:hypothetical protein